MDGFHFWWCGWLRFIIPWFNGCGFCRLVAVEVDRRLAWVLAVGLAGGYGFWPMLEVEREREVGGFLSDGF